MYYFEDQNVDLVGEIVSRVEEPYTHARGEGDPSSELVNGLGVLAG